MDTSRVEFAEDASVPPRSVSSTRSKPYKLLGFVSVQVGFFVAEGARWVLLVPTALGEVCSHIVSGARISPLIGFGVVFVNFVLGCLIGGGMLGAMIDEVNQRVIEVLLSIPTALLWMALAAVIPRDCSVMQIYVATTIVLAVVGCRSGVHRARQAAFAARGGLHPGGQDRRRHLD